MPSVEVGTRVSVKHKSICICMDLTHTYFLFVLIYLEIKRHGWKGENRKKHTACTHKKTQNLNGTSIKK
jgi:hypothetical protein